MRTIVLVNGVLRGMGHETQCEMLAIREKSPNQPPLYRKCSVIESPPNMPDGEYTVSFDHATVKVYREGGLWLAGDDQSLTGAA